MKRLTVGRLRAEIALFAKGQRTLGELYFWIGRKTYWMDRDYLQYCGSEVQEMVGMVILRIYEFTNPMPIKQNRQWRQEMPGILRRACGLDAIAPQPDIHE